MMEKKITDLGFTVICNKCKKQVDEISVTSKPIRISFENYGEVVCECGNEITYYYNSLI